MKYCDRWAPDTLLSLPCHTFFLYLIEETYLTSIKKNIPSTPEPGEEKTFYRSAI
jgi:hypothetical protein